MPDQECLRRFAAPIDWLNMLRTIDEATWDRPVDLRKWSMKAVVLHIFYKPRPLSVERDAAFNP